MDPITVPGFVAAIAALIDVTSKVVSYCNDVKDAPKDRAKLAQEAANLYPLFTSLRYRVEVSSSTEPWFIALRSLGGKGGPLMEFKSAMEDIADKLAPPPTRVASIGKDLRWRFDKKKIDATLSKIERLKKLVGLALQKDHFNLSLAMKEENIANFQEIKTSRDVEKINQWLAAPLPSSNHNAAMKKRQPRTGEWFTQSKQFSDWKIGGNSLIWLHGIPGCGKTILCSTIIQDVISHYQSDPTTAVAYFYFDFNDHDSQRTEKLVRSLIVQLAAQRSHLPELLQSAHSQSQDGQKQPTFGDMTAILRQILRLFNTTYILLDALDECTDREELLEFTKTLMGWNFSNLHILTTSRKENDIATSLEPLVTCQLCIQSALVDADIHIHILERLSNDPKLEKWSDDVKKEIEDALMRGANGMFRWVVCQLESLRKCLKLDALRKALNTLPKTLDDTYERILSNLDEEYEEDVLKVFQWLCFSGRPLRLNEMVEVLAIDLTPDSCFRPEQRLPDHSDILSICSTLVNVTAAADIATSSQTTGNQELRLAHFSVKEYLISERLKKGSMHCYHITSLAANVSIAKACLTYLLYFKSPTILAGNFHDGFPLLKYAAEFWPWHYRNITNDTDRQAVNFLGYTLVESKNSCFINWLRIFEPDNLWYKPNLNLKIRDINLEINKTSSPLYYFSYLGVGGVVQLLLNKEADVNAEGLYGNPLSAASTEGHEGVVRLLLDKGANVNAEGGHYGSALIAASNEGHQEVVRLLLQNEANVNFESGTYGSALIAASSHGYEGVVRLLLENEANVNAVYGRALLAASSEGHEVVVRLLLENGANVNAKGGRYGSALIAASSHGYEGVVRLLLENGANVNAVYSRALLAASSGGHEVVVRLLLENGANVNAEGPTYHNNALSAASVAGHEEVVRLLLENGAKFNAEGGTYGSALIAASSGGYEGVVRLLLENGANFNAEGGTYGSALIAASSGGYEGVVRLLLENGANVNAEGPTYHNNALSAASVAGHEEVVRLLLENGANFNAEGGTYGSALIAASSGGYEGVVRLLLENGANFNAEGGTYGSALIAASHGGHEEAVRLLLENGANVNAESKTCGSALTAASTRGHEVVVRLLLENGAKVNAKGGTYGSALIAASSYGYEAVLRLLLDKGADVNAEGGTYGSALIAASSRSYEAVVRLLLENGANVNVVGGTYGSALSAALNKGYEDVVQLLRENGAT